MDKSQDRILKHQTQKSPVKTRLLSNLNLVPVGGLEPPHPKAGDFESPMSTNSITLALNFYFYQILCMI